MLASQLHRVKSLRNLPHTRNIAINTLGNYVGYAFAGFYIVFLVRIFDPVQFGILSVLQAFSYLMANVLSFGIPASIYAHVPEYLPNKKKAFDFIASNFLILTLLSFISLCILYLLSPLLDVRIFKTGAPQSWFMWALIGTQLYIWQNFMRDVLNAAGHFMHINVASNLSHIVKALLLIWCAVHGTLSIPAVLIIMGVAGPGFVFAYVILRRQWIIRALLSARPARSEIRFTYTLLYFISTQVFSLATRADLFLVAYFLSKPEVGFYGLSQRIILAVVTSSDSITQVMSAQFARIRSQSEVHKLLKHSFGYMIVPTAMFIGGILMPSFVYTVVFGQDYSSSISLTRALSFVYIPYSFLAALLLFFLYTIKKPHYLLISNLIFLGCILIGNLFLIPQIRIFGPAVSYLVSFIIMSIYLVHSYSCEVRRLPEEA